MLFLIFIVILATLFRVLGKACYHLDNDLSNKSDKDYQVFKHGDYKYEAGWKTGEGFENGKRVSYYQNRHGVQTIRYHDD